MGIQELLMHFHPVFALLVIPGILLIGLLALPWLRYDANVSGIWFCSATGRKTAILALVSGAVLAVAGVLASEHGLLGPGIISGGLIPFSAAILVTAIFWFLVRKAFQASMNEAVQAIFTLLISAFITLTLIGVWFRGSGMQLMWAG
jgi:hypothetical protein